jgi:hypothetical protein
MCQRFGKSSSGGHSMKIKISLSVDGQQVKQDETEIADEKLEALTEEEVEAAIEMAVRRWADQKLSIVWEAEGRDQTEEDTE